MSDARVYQLLNNVESQSAIFGVTASQLSDKLEELIARLEALPGKLPVEVNSPDGWLSFHRGSADEGWTLWYHDGHPPLWKRVADLQVKQKLRAARLIESLLSDLFGELRDANQIIAHIQSSPKRES